jgi:type IV secretion system protein VirB3
MALPTSPIHRSLSRPHLVLGADRELVLVSLLIAAVLIGAALNGWAAVYGAVFWTVTLWLLRKMAKADPLMRQVYLRALGYQAFYRACRTPWQDGQRREVR